MFSEVYAENAPWNDTHWKHERFNKLLKEARAELDKAKRHEMYGEMQGIVRDKGGVVIPTFSSTLDAATTKLRYEKLAANFELDGLRVPERWWFES
jgi:peptide/nickel transport system substrate-binding protein